MEYWHTMSEVQASTYKQSVFDEKVLQFCLSVVDFVEVFPADNELLRRAVLDAISFCRSMEEVAAYLSALKTSLQNKSKFNPSDLLSVAKAVGQDSPAVLYDFLLTIEKLGVTTHFSHLRDQRGDQGSNQGTKLWSEFFNGVHILVKNQVQLADFLNTTRFLCDAEEDSEWEEFFSATKSLQKEKSQSLQDFFTTVRFLAPTKFPAWSSFYTACKKLSLSNKGEAAFFEAVRHSRHYFLTSQSFQGILRALSETPEYSNALAFGQLDSKKWLIEEALKVWGSAWGNTVFVLAGWVGLLPRMMYDQNIEVLKVRSFDVDATANLASESINQVEVQQDWAYKSSTQDITQMQYPATYKVLRKDGRPCELCEMPDVVINTSCEHIADINSWWKQIPTGTKVILQSNNGFHIPEHVACFKNLADFAATMQLSRTDYAGEKDLPEFKRFMLIGVK